MSEAGKGATRPPRSRALGGWTAALLASALLSATQPALAFTDHLTFGLPAAEGGGGGRYFSGAPGDGFTCAVCHVGNPVEPAVFSDDTLALFEEGYVPGQTYFITLELEDQAGGVLEITDRNGAPMGTMQLPEPMGDDECDGETNLGDQAVFLLGDGQGRQVAVSDSCGETRVEVQWIAPANATPGIVVRAASVIGGGGPEPDDGEDRVQTAAIPFPVAGDAPEGTRVSTACAASPASSSPPSLPPLLLFVGASWLWRRRV